MLTLYKHQEVALSYLRANDSFALFMEQGTGKTLVVLVRLLELLQSGAIENYLIVAPKAALGAWRRDIEKFEPEAQGILENAGTFVNYDRVWQRDDTKIWNPKTEKVEVVKSGSPREEYAGPYGAVVLDEAHYIKNRTSKRAEAVLKISLSAQYRYILTGTPISNGQLENIWSLYAFLKPYQWRGRIYSEIFRDYMNENAHGVYRGSYTEFSNRYCLLDRYFKPYRYQNVKELQHVINEHSYRVKKAECLDLPEKLSDELVHVDLLEKALYKRMATASALPEYDLLAENPLSRLVKLRQIASGFITTTDGVKELKSEKPAILQELLEGFADDKKIVIFAEFKYSIAIIQKLLKKMKYSCVALDGEQKDKTIWRQFQEDPAIRVIVCQYQTANAGIDLYASDTIIYYEPTLRSTILEQSRDRIHRTGQTNKCSYLHLITTGTVEEHIYKALAGYSDFNEKLFSEYMTTYQRNFHR